jgi:SAM-dependent methyltransferase
MLLQIGAIDYFNRDPAKESFLDYGCGYGKDVEELNRLGFDVEGYDPYVAKWCHMPRRTFDVVFCTYVLCVIFDEGERNDVLSNIRRKLKKNGTAYITVRRDIPREGTSRTCWVELDLPIVAVTKNFVTYSMGK